MHRRGQVAYERVRGAVVNIVEIRAHIHIVRYREISRPPGKRSPRLTKERTVLRIRKPGEWNAAAGNFGKIPVVYPFTYNFAARVLVLTGCLVENPYATTSDRIANDNGVRSRFGGVSSKNHFDFPIVCKSIKMERAVGGEILQRRRVVLAIGCDSNSSIVLARYSNAGNVHHIL